MAGRYRERHTNGLMREVDSLKAMVADLRRQLRRDAKDAAEARALRAAIQTHHARCHAGDWGYDDELWKAIGYDADPKVLG